MATTLADNVGKITFVVGVTTYDVDKSDIKGVNLNRSKGRIEVQVASSIISGNYIYITYSEVTSPTDKSIGALYTKLINWWKEPNSRSCRFIAETDQVTFDCWPRIRPSADSPVHVDGEKTLFPFTITGTQVVFDEPMMGYEEIEVTK